MFQYSLGTRLDKKALHVSPQMHGRAKEKYKTKSNQICHCCFLPLFHVVLVVLHYELSLCYTEH